jgi:hypothetical protein
MRRWSFAASVTTLCLPVLVMCTAAAEDAALTPALTALETKWLGASEPVLNYADQQQLPIDVIVQPQAAVGDVPLSMGVANGRCKLVFSLRGNPDAESTIANLPAELQTVAIEAMAAHEVAHCWRYMNGMWHALPAGFVAGASEIGNSAQLAAQQKAMRDTRREEGFADLVGLAWTLHAHAEQYAAIHAWFERVRADQPVASSFHDTRRWLTLAVQPQQFPSATTPFEQAIQLWTEGLQSL